MSRIDPREGQWMLKYHCGKCGYKVYQDSRMHGAPATINWTETFCGCWPHD
jgi:hypothetical protein